MRFINIFCGLVSIAMVVGLSSCASSKKIVTQKLNVVFFLVDDLGWTDLGCYGSNFYETPNIDQFAKNGVKFTNAYAACHVCSPTRASILTGKYPATLDLTDWIRGRRDFDFQMFLNAEHKLDLPLEEETIAEALKQEEYSTAIIGKWHLGGAPSGPLAHGFDVWLPGNWYRGAPNRTYYSPYGLDGLEDAAEGEYLTDRITDEALKFIDQNKANPFFLYLSHFAVHDPIQGRKDLVEKYERKLKKSPTPSGIPFILEGNPDDKNPLTKQELTALMDKPQYEGHKVFPKRTVKIKQHQDNVEFAGMVESVDQSLGRVLAKLDELGLDDNTIVIFFSDNGGMAAANWYSPKREVPDDKIDKAYSTSNLPLRGAKGWLYEGGIREPLIIKWPGQGKAGTECDVPVISTDFFPTILEMLGLPIPSENNLDGVSIANLVRGENEMDREAIYWHFPHYSNHGMQSPGGAIRSGDYKLLEYFENNTVQLFNLKNDIGEQNDLTASQPDKANELKAMLHKWREDVGANMMMPNPNYKP